MDSRGAFYQDNLISAFIELLSNEVLADGISIAFYVSDIFGFQEITGSEAAPASG